MEASPQQAPTGQANPYASPSRPTADSEARPAGKGQLSLWDTISVIIGIVVGVGIYETPPGVFNLVPSATAGMAVWAIGGLLCLIGAFTYAELASTYPRSGGDYVYLTRAFGPWMGFLFGWAQLAVIMTGSIGMMAYVFADYATNLWGLGRGVGVIFAAGAVIALSALHVLGVKLGSMAQNIMTVAKIIGLLGVLLAGLFFAGSPADAVPLADAAAEGASLSFGAIAFAMVLVFITYGGWNDAAFFVAEMQDRRKISLALILGVLAITVIFMLINLAYLSALGIEGVRASTAVAADTIERALGRGGSQLMSLLVMISALSALNGLIFAGSRIYSSLGADHGAFARLGQWNERLGSPVHSIVTQGIITLGMILMIGSPFGQEFINGIFRRFGFADIAWSGHGGFETLLRCTAPIFWIFFLLTSLSLFVLRYKDRDIQRPFKAPLYPVLPLVFVATCGYMVYSSVMYAGTLGLIGAALLVLGLPLYWVSKPLQEPLAQPAASN